MSSQGVERQPNNSGFTGGPRRSRLAATGILIAVLSFASGALLGNFPPWGVVCGMYMYLVLAVTIVIGYTIIAFVRDDPEIVLLWPGVTFLVVALGLWTLRGTGEPPWVAGLAVVFAVLLPLGLLLIAATLVITSSKGRLGLVHPVLLSAMQNTQPTGDLPAPVTILAKDFRFHEWTRLATFLRKEKLVDTIRVRRDHVLIGMARVAGLPRFWSRLLLPFGRTTLRVDANGLATILVDPHVYRLLERPGPHLRYCQNLLEAFSTMTGLVSNDRLEDARHVGMAP